MFKSRPPTPAGGAGILDEIAQGVIASSSIVTVKQSRLSGVPALVIRGMEGKPCAIRIFDGRGKMVAGRSVKIGTNTVIPMNKTGAGVYLVRVSWSSGTMTVPVVIAR